MINRLYVSRPKSQHYVNLGRAHCCKRQVLKQKHVFLKFFFFFREVVHRSWRNCNLHFQLLGLKIYLVYSPLMGDISAVKLFTLVPPFFGPFFLFFVCCLVNTTLMLVDTLIDTGAHEPCSIETFITLQYIILS